MAEDARFKDAVEWIGKGRRFLVVSHVNPEGDAVGSLLGLYLGLKSLGKEAVAYLEDGVPEVFGFLPGASEVVTRLDPDAAFDVTFAVDCGQKERLGKGFCALKNPGKIINVDHHETNDRFGDYNVITPDASAAGEMVYDLLKAASIKVSKEMAVCLYVSIHTDTGSFRYSSSTPDSFIKAGELVRLGADPWEVSRQVYENYPAKKFKLLGLVLNTLDIMKSGANGGGDIARVVVTMDMMKSTGTGKDMADGFVNYARGIQGVEVGVLFRESGPSEYKISMRSKGRVNVATVAESFGGGGHSHAAGCNLKGTLAEVEEKVIAALRRSMAAA